MTILARRLCSRWLYHNASVCLRRPAINGSAPNIIHQELRDFHGRSSPLQGIQKPSGDERINDLGRAIEDEFAMIRETYGLRLLLLLHGCITELMDIIHSHA
jgi:hypothetical protein